MNTLGKTLAPMIAAVAAYAPERTAMIGTNSIPIEFSSSETRVFDTNRVVREFNKYFSRNDDLEHFFGFEQSGVEEGESIQLTPEEFEGGIPEDEAEDVVCFAPPDAKIVVGESALGWLLGQFELADAMTNGLDRLDALFAELADGSITNDPVRCRETFVAGGKVVSDSLSDEEMLAGFRDHWTKIRFRSPSVFSLRRVRLSESGPEITGAICEYSDPEHEDWDPAAYYFVNLDGRWRIVLQ